MENRIICFGKFETASVLINALIIKVLLGLPQLLCEQVGSAAWIVPAVSGVVFLALVFVIMLLYRKFPGKNIIHIAEHLGGAPLKWAVAVLIVLPLIYKGAITLRLAAETINLITPYRIPSLLTAVLVGLAMIVTSYRGIEGVVRTHAIFVPLILIALIIVLLASFGSYHLTNLFPIWGLGRGTVLKASASAILMYTDVVYIFLLAPYVKSQKIYSRAIAWGTGLAMLFQLVIVISYVLTTQYPENASLFMPVYQVSRIINFSKNSQSIEAIFYPVWIISSLLYLSLSNCFAVEILGQATGTKYEKLFIVPIAALMFIIGYLPPSVTEAMQMSSKATPMLAVFTMLLPVMILAAASIKKRGRKRYEA